MNKPFMWFVKITGYPLEHFYYHKKIHYENGDKNLRKIEGPALIISNHTSVYDYPLIWYTFPTKTIRTLVGEGLYKYKSLKRLLNHMGGIKVDRQNFDFSFLTTMSQCLKKGQFGLIFPESRVHTEKDPPGLLEFKPSYVYIALENNVPIIPVYVNGVYGRKKRKANRQRARIMVGKPIIPNLLLDEKKTTKENIININNFVKNRIEQLKKELDKQTS